MGALHPHIGAAPACRRGQVRMEGQMGSMGFIHQQPCPAFPQYPVDFNKLRTQAVIIRIGNYHAGCIRVFLKCLLNCFRRYMGDQIPVLIIFRLDVNRIGTAEHQAAPDRFMAVAGISTLSPGRKDAIIIMWIPEVDRLRERSMHLIRRLAASAGLAGLPRKEPAGCPAPALPSNPSGEGGAAHLETACLPYGPACERAGADLICIQSVC